MTTYPLFHSDKAWLLKGSPSHLTPQEAIGLFHDVCDHRVLKHAFTRPGEIRAFGAAIYRNRMDVFGTPALFVHTLHDTIGPVTKLKRLPFIQSPGLIPRDVNRMAKRFFRAFYPSASCFTRMAFTRLLADGYWHAAAFWGSRTVARRNTFNASHNWPLRLKKCALRRKPAAVVASYADHDVNAYVYLSFG